MNVGLIDVDGHNFPNFALMRTSAYYKLQGHNVEWANMFNEYDKVVASKIFTFSQDFNYLSLRSKEFIKGGTGYDINSKLPDVIEQSLAMIS